MSLLKSRKFKLTLAAVLMAVAAALTGEIAWSEAVTLSILAFIVNVLGITIEDAAYKLGLKK